MYKKTHSHRYSGVRRGVAAVEAAVCLPVLALIVFGSVEVSSGIFQEYNAQACMYELGKTALAAKTSCDDVQILADQMLPQWGFTDYDIDIDVVTRTVNSDSVDLPTQTHFDIIPGTLAPAGLEELPRGTLLRMTMSATRPPTTTDFLRGVMGNQVSSECIFVKEF